MIKNNNQAVIKCMAKKNLKSNLRRSVTIIVAVLLSSFLLFSVFTVGLTYLKMQRLGNIRLNGGDFDAIMYGVTEVQKEFLETDREVEQFGILTVTGTVKETEADKTPGVGLVYADETLWNKMMAPARKFTEGVYPEKVDELMVTEAALKKCGFSDKKIGDEIQFVYESRNQQHEKTFRISGIWNGFGDPNDFYVSKAFCEQQGVDELYDSRCNISFHRKWMSEKEQQAFIEHMDLQKSQRFFYVYEFGNAIILFLGLAGVVLVTCLSAYLLIYNIMYLSIAGNIRYYGLLQTIGMTGKQIRRLLKQQMIWIWGIGSVLGIFFGCGISFFLIPVVIKSVGIQKGMAGEIHISFHPIIFLLTILLTGFTVWYAARKPMKIAESRSPIEALGYQQVSRVRRNHKTRRGKLIWRMAVEQLMRNKKKTLITMLSLAASLSVFVCLITMLHTQSAREYIYNYRGLDMVVSNDTIQNIVTKQDEQDLQQLQGIKQILNKDILDQIRNVKGVSEVFPITCAPAVIPWEPEVADMWMREFYETWMNIPYEDEMQEYKEHPENFGTSLIGITESDFHAINAELEEPVDETAFLNGETCILYRNGLYGLDNEKILGKTIHCTEYGNGKNNRSFKIAGLTDIKDYIALLGYPPTIIVSNHVVDEFTQEPIVFKAGIQYEEEFDERAEQEIQRILLNSPDATDFSWSSKIQLIQKVQKAQGHMMEVGIGIVVVLAIIGVMNYINTSVGNMQNHRKVISIMESVGMTEGQVKKMLVWEGVLYTVGVVLLTLTVGLGIIYSIYQSVNYMGAEFWFPTIPFLGAVVILMGICVVVPLLSYGGLKKSGSLVERIKAGENI